MSSIVGRAVWRIVTIAIGIPVGILAKKGVERAWLAARPGDPPRKAKDPAARWSDAVGYAALSAAGIAAAQVVTRKSAASVWRSLLGTEPPAPPRRNSRLRRRSRLSSLQACGSGPSMCVASTLDRGMYRGLSWFRHT